MADQLDQKHPYGHDFNDARPAEDKTKNLLHSIRGGVMGGNEYRVHNMPRCKIYTAAAIPLAAPFNAEVAWLGTAAQSVVWDTDSMAVASPYITIKTPGIYQVSGYGLFSGGGVANIGIEMALIKNSNTSNIMAIASVKGDPQTWGTYVTPSAPELLIAGDRISMYLSVTANINFTGAPVNPWISAVMLSTL